MFLAFSKLLDILNLSSYLGPGHGVSSAQWVHSKRSKRSTILMLQAGNLQQDLLLSSLSCMILRHSVLNLESPFLFNLYFGHCLKYSGLT